MQRRRRCDAVLDPSILTHAAKQQIVAAAALRPRPLVSTAGRLVCMYCFTNIRHSLPYQRLWSYGTMALYKIMYYYYFMNIWIGVLCKFHNNADLQGH